MAPYSIGIQTEKTFSSSVNPIVIQSSGSGIEIRNGRKLKFTRNFRGPS